MDQKVDLCQCPKTHCIRHLKFFSGLSLNPRTPVNEGRPGKGMGHGNGVEGGRAELRALNGGDCFIGYGGWTPLLQSVYAGRDGQKVNQLKHHAHPCMT